ncbi:hypothetical protein P3T35_006406 [Kitasatospora sp. GP30]|nr:hypothetical protein [Kitasatospora sp. GP30]MDH6144364.1 hypothetical protein [Kitasatospora sp. GP30]
MRTTSRTDGAYPSRRPYGLPPSEDSDDDQNTSNDGAPMEKVTE